MKNVIAILLTILTVTAHAQNENDLLGGTMEGCPPGAINCSPGSNGTIDNETPNPKKYICTIRQGNTAAHPLESREIARKEVTTTGTGRYSTESFSQGPVTVTAQTVYGAIAEIRIRNTDMDAESFAENEHIFRDDYATPTANLVDLKSGATYKATCHIPLVIRSVPTGRR